MRKAVSWMSLLSRMATYLAAAAFFIWRSQSIAVFDTATFYTGVRAMCIILGILLVLAAVADSSVDQESAS